VGIDIWMRFLERLRSVNLGLFPSSQGHRGGEGNVYLLELGL
jgi:hypothetical protein